MQNYLRLASTLLAISIVLLRTAIVLENIHRMHQRKGHLLHANTVDITQTGY
jgi:hypothetical protein